MRTRLLMCTVALSGLAIAARLASAQAIGEPDIRLLKGYHWMFVDGQSSSGARLEVFFPTDYPSYDVLRVHVGPNWIGSYAGCNSVSDSFDFVDGRLMSTALMQTLIGCQSDIDKAMAEFFQGNPRLAVRDGHPPRLELVAENGDRLTFDGDPTPQTLYGSEGEMVHLEVAKHTIPCNLPAAPTRNCLQVRVLTMGNEGVETAPPGPWQLLYQEIQGYDHRDGVRVKLKALRFALNQPSAVGFRSVYVFMGEYMTDGLAAYWERRDRLDRERAKSQSRRAQTSARSH